MFDTLTLDQFRASLRGRLVEPDHSDYDQVRALYNAMIEKRPALIAQCRDAADVIASVTFARVHQLPLAVRGGGHSGPGLGSVDDGLLIDLSPMRGVRVDPAAKTVRVEGGCTWGDVDHATHAFGLAAVSGVISTTGVGGLTLGGGHGYLTRKYGLTIDNLLSADVVLADGRLVHANKKENPDLFWALRGGGGNFGVVTSFEFKLHPVDTVIGGPMFWPIEQLEKTMRWYRDWIVKQSKDIYAFYLVAEVPAADPFPVGIRGRKVCGLIWCCQGPAEKAERAVKRARRAAKPMFEFVGPMPFPMLQTLFDGLYPRGEQWYWKGDFVHELSNDAIASHKQFCQTPTSKSTMHLYPVDGAVHKVDAQDTAWNVRDANWSMVIVGVDPDRANADRIKEWTRAYWEALHPYSAKASYINFMMEEGSERIRATYGENYPRLARVKAQYDPENLFHVNQNIEPAK